MVDEKELKELLDFSSETFDEKMVTSDGKGAQEVFCQGWPATKSVLEAISLLIKIPIGKKAIEIIIKAGDAYSKKHCQ